eukprot:COSAG02_NODE_8542_length_2531_cov_63.764391_1_plen_144_part_00
MGSHPSRSAALVALKRPCGSVGTMMKKTSQREGSSASGTLKLARIAQAASLTVTAKGSTPGCSMIETASNHQEHQLKQRQLGSKRLVQLLPSGEHSVAHRRNFWSCWEAKVPIQVCEDVDWLIFADNLADFLPKSLGDGVSDS